MIPQRIYLDTNQLYGWFENQLNRKKPESKIVEFLTEKFENAEKFISMYTIAELLVNLKNAYPDRNLSADKIAWLLILLKEATNLKIIEESKLTKEVIDFADLCNDHNDAVHIQIAKNQGLTFVTKDDKVGKVKSAYPNVISIRKLFRTLS